MFKWILKQFSKSEAVVAVPQKAVKPTRSPLTPKEQVHAILVSYKSGKISLERAVDLLLVWRLRKFHD